MILNEAFWTAPLIESPRPPPRAYRLAVTDMHQISMPVFPPQSAILAGRHETKSLRSRYLCRKNIQYQKVGPISMPWDCITKIKFAVQVYSDHTIPPGPGGRPAHTEVTGCTALFENFEPPSGLASNSFLIQGMKLTGTVFRGAEGGFRTQFPVEQSERAVSRLNPKQSESFIYRFHGIFQAAF